MTFSTDALEVNRRDTSLTRMQVDQLCDEDELGDGTVRMRVDRLAITANTVTYAAILHGQPQSLKSRLGTVGPRDARAPEPNKDLP